MTPPALLSENDRSKPIKILKMIPRKMAIPPSQVIYDQPLREIYNSPVLSTELCFSEIIF